MTRVDDLHKGWMKDSAYRREYEALEEEFSLEALLMEGLAGRDDIPLTRQLWTEIKTEARQIAAKHKPRKRRP
jgi:hypothetical protein